MNRRGEKRRKTQARRLRKLELSRLFLRFRRLRLPTGAPLEIWEVALLQMCCYSTLSRTFGYNVITSASYKSEIAQLGFVRVGKTRL